MTRWNQGRSTVDSLIGSGGLERVPANEVECRSSEAPTVTPEEVAADLTKVEALIELAEKSIPNMPRY